MGEWKLSATENFVRDFESQTQRHRAVTRIRHMRRMIEELDVEWVTKYKLLSSPVGAGRVYRDVLTDAQGGSRLLFSVNGREIKLLGFDLHDDAYDKWNRLTAGQKLAMTSGAGELPSELDVAFSGNQKDLDRKAKLSRDNSHLRIYYPEEDSKDWAFHLTPAQEETIFEILEAIESNDELPIFLILGSAGTGKTIALIQMATLLEPEHLNLRLPNSVRSFYAKLGNPLPPHIPNIREGDIVLVDDPRSVEEVRGVLNSARTGGARALVVALDPYQLMRSSGLLELVDFLEQKLPYLFHFQVAFRQRERVGSRTLKLSAVLYQASSDVLGKGRFIAEKTKWLRERYLDEVTFPHQGGVFRAPQLGNADELLEKEVLGVLNRSFRWTWTEPVLIVWGDDGLKSERFRNLQKNIFKQVDFSDPESVRGTEYQEVIVVLSKTDWLELTGSGSMQTDATWNESSPIHMFLTRARDTVTVLIDDERNLQLRLMGIT